MTIEATPPLIVPLAVAGSPPATITRPPLVLIADDQEWSARAFESVLGPGGFAVLRCSSARHVLEQVRFVAPDLLLVKHDLPDAGGAALVEQMRREGRLSASTPLFVTAAVPLQRTERLAVLRAGAWEVVQLPLDAEELLVRLRTLSRAKFEADRVRQESLLDPGTGLYSVQGLLRRARELGAQALRRPTPLSCAVLAPEPGWTDDAAQSEPDEAQAGLLARLVSRVARKSDVVGRVSQREFAILAPGAGASEVLLLARRLVTGATTEGPDGSGTALRVRVGCSAVDHFGEVAMDPVELLVRATMALRRAQRDATSPAVCLYDESVAMA